MEKALNKTIYSIKRFGKNSIFFNIQRSILLIIIIPFMLISLITGSYYSKAVKSEETRLSREIYESISASFSSAIDETDSFRSQLISSPESQIFFSIKDITNISSYPYSLMNEMYRTINTYAGLSTKIESVGIYNYYNNYSISTSGGGKKADIFSNEPWYKYNPQNIMFCTKGVSKDGRETFCICYPVYGNGELLATIVFTAKPELLYDDDERQYALALYDDYNNEIWSKSNMESVPTKLELNFAMTNGASEVNFDRRFVSVVGKVHENTIAITLQREEAYTKAILWFFFAGLALSLLIAIILSVASSVSTYKKMEQIVDSLNYLNNSDSQFASAQDETSFILESISYMNEKNISLEKDLLEKIAELNRLQISALQMQINPHYLFNTLNVLNLTVMDMNGVKNPASKIITKLSKILSYTINVSQLTATVEEELQYCSEYIDIEKIRNDNFEVNWDVDESILKCKIPKFILQPILENAFKYGLKHLKDAETGILNIKATRNDDGICFEIANNGELIEEDMVETINKNFNTDGGMRSIHIGLENVNRRIKLICGNKYGCEASLEDGFTVLRVNVDFKE